MKKRLWALLLTAAITAVMTIPYGMAQAEGEAAGEAVGNAADSTETEGMPAADGSDAIDEMQEITAMPEAVQTAEEENYDITPPVINSISMDKQEQTVTDEDIVTISVDAYDAGVGIECVEVSLRYVEGGYDYSYGASYRTLTLIYNNTTSKYEYSLTADSVSGKYFIGDVTVFDRNKNSTQGVVDSMGHRYVDAACDALYWYELKRTDNEAPVIESVQLTKDGAEVTRESILTVGDTVHIAVRATDNAGLSATSTIGFRSSDDSSFEEMVSLQYQQGSQCYEGDFAITDNCHPGEWYAHSISVKDTSGNSTWYPSALANTLRFTIKNDDFDAQKPIVQSVSMERTGEILHAGDTIKIRANVIYDGAIDIVDAWLFSAVDSSRIVENIRLVRVGETDTYEGIFTVTENTYPCEWYLAAVRAWTTSGKSVSVYKDPSTDVRLEAEYYVNVQQGNTFVNPTYRVTFAGLDADDEVVEKEFEVPRRTTAEELFRLQIDLPEHPQLNFVEWVLSDGYGAVYDDPIDVILSDANIWTKYDKVAVEFMIYMEDDQGGESYDTVKKEYAAPGATVEIPREVNGYKNIVWRDDNNEVITADTITVDEDAVWFFLVLGTAEIDPDHPAQSDTPETAQDSEKPGQGSAGSTAATLTEQQIAGVIAQINQTAEGGKVAVSMDDATVVPKAVIEAIRGRDIDLVLQMNGYTWTINGTTVLSTNLTDVNLEVTRNTSYIPSAVVSELAGSNPVEQISLTHNGDFGFTALLTLNMGGQNAGKKGSLYYHDSNGRMVFIDAGVIEESGNVSLAFSHASDYAIVMEQNAATAKPSGLKTGDDTPVKVYLWLALSAGVIAAATAGRRIYRHKAGK